MLIFDPPPAAPAAPPADSRRRRFLLTLAAGTAMSASPPLLAEAPAQPDAVQPDSRGYRRTEHVRKYYTTARL